MPITADDDASSPRPVALHNLELTPARRSVIVRGAAVSMTRMEFQLLYLLASNPGIVFTRQRLIAKLQRGEVHVSPRSVDAVVRRLRKKIETDPSSPRLLLTVWGDGYKFADL